MRTGLDGYMTAQQMTVKSLVALRTATLATRCTTIVVGMGLDLSPRRSGNVTKALTTDLDRHLQTIENKRRRHSEVWGVMY